MFENSALAIRPYHRPWQQDADLLYADNGGHGMLFRTFDSQLMLALHRPNKRPVERPLFLPVREEVGRLTVNS